MQMLADMLREAYETDGRWKEAFKTGASLGATAMKTKAAHLIVALEDDTIGVTPQTRIFVQKVLDAMYELPGDDVANEVFKSFETNLMEMIEQYEQTGRDSESAS